jgi:hypothetical protein
MDGEHKWRSKHLRERGSPLGSGLSRDLILVEGEEALCGPSRTFIPSVVQQAGSRAEEKFAEFFGATTCEAASGAFRGQEQKK